jgi:hypothetical protein
MAITVGTDTYISLADANTYVTNNYASTEALRVSWAALSDSDKESYLRKACKKLDRQILIGQKALTTQTLQFPRAWKTPYFYNQNIPSTVYYQGDYTVESAVANEVKYAQVEEALSLIGGTSDRVTMQREGVKSFSLGSLSETFDGSKKSAQELTSDEAREFLKFYILGCVEIV